MIDFTDIISGIFEGLQLYDYVDQLDLCDSYIDQTLIEISTSVDYAWLAYSNPDNEDASWAE